MPGSSLVFRAPIGARGPRCRSLRYATRHLRAAVRPCGSLVGSRTIRGVWSLVFRTPIRARGPRCCSLRPSDCGAPAGGRSALRLPGREPNHSRRSLWRGDSVGDQPTASANARPQRPRSGAKRNGGNSREDERPDGRSKNKKSTWSRQAPGGSAIIAVNSQVEVVLPSTLASPANLQTRLRCWVNSTWRSSRQPGSTGARNLAPSMPMK